MTTVKETNAAPQWQTFHVENGMISRTETGQVEGMLRLASGMALTFKCDLDGTHWTWLPEEPDFMPDRSAD